MAQMHIQGPNIREDPDLGLALFLPLSRHLPKNVSVSSDLHRDRVRNPRKLSDESNVNAKMTLYDDLLTKGYV